MRKLLRFLSLLAVSTLAVPSLHAQAVTAQAQLNGSVRDQTGGVVPKASVSLRNVDTNQSYATTSNEAGYYIFTNVPPGNYALSAESSGFSKYEQTGIALLVAQIATIDISLKPGGFTEKVKVNSEAPVIEPTRTEVAPALRLAIPVLSLLLLTRQSFGFPSAASAT